MKSSLFPLVLCALLALFPVRAARADLGFWSANLIGTWRHPGNGDSYRFRSDATYTFTAGAAKRRAGNVSHSGRWKIVMPTAKESGGSSEGPVALVLTSRSRVVLERSKRRVLKSGRAFRLVVDVVTGNNGVVDKRYYRFNGVRWIRKVRHRLRLAGH